MHYRDVLLRIEKELTERKSDLLYELGGLPAGELLCTDQKDGYRRYMQRLPARGNRKKEHRYGVKKQPEVLQGLVRKEYVTGALKVIDIDLRVLEDTIRKYRPVDEKTIMQPFLTKYPELNLGLYGSDEFIEEWRKGFTRIDNFHPEELKHTAADGTRNRSKNELYIASRLDHHGIVYRWDCPTGIPGVFSVPDFTIIRARDGKTIYWEHCGMMDDPYYKKRNTKRLKEYEEAGIVPWDNLIVTYDTLEGGLRGDLVEAMIKCWLL